MEDQIGDGEIVEPNEEIAEVDEETIEPNEEIDEGTNEETNEEVSEIDEEADAELGKPVSRAQNRIQKLSSDLKAERAGREKLVAEHATAKAQLDALQQQQRDNAAQVEQRAEEERLALLDPEDRELYNAKQQTKHLEYRLQQLEMEQRDSRDRTEFHAKAAHDETYGKYAKQVEDMYQEGFRRGVVAPREDLHSLILGQELKKNAQANTPAKKAAAKKRVAAVTSTSTNARSDVRGSKRGKTAEERLLGVEI